MKVPALAASANYTATIALAVSPRSALRVTADVTNVVKESVETDNLRDVWCP